MIIKVDKNSFAINILLYFFSMLLIVDCRSIWLHLTTTNSMINIIIAILIILTSLAIIILKGKVPIKIINKAISFGILFLLYIMVYIIMRPYNIKYFLRLFITVAVILIFSLIYCNEYTYLDILLKYRNIILLIALVSLFFWLFGSLLNVIQPSGYVYTTWTGSVGSIKAVSNYYNVYYNTQEILIFGKNICRNTAIFNEAPMASFHFSIAFLTELFLVDSQKKWRYILLCIAIISTFSLTGYLVILLTIGGKYYLAYKQARSKTKISLLIMAPALIMIIMMFLVFALYNQLLKYQLNSVTGNFSSLESFLMYFRAWKTHPLFGFGFEGSVNDAVGGVALIRNNSVVSIFIKGGIYFFLLYFICFINSIRKCKLNGFTNVKVFLFLVLFVVSLTVVNEQYITFFLMFCFCSKKTIIQT
ncbi:MAG: hypothetical protein LIO99_01360 [Clostridiales bacterium]|nr:hypothetical protein [Clostridiales bacterium]